LFCAVLLVALDRIGNRLLRIIEILKDRTVTTLPAKEDKLHRWECRFVTPHWRSDQMQFVYWVDDDVDEELTERMEGKDTTRVMAIFGAQGWELVDIVLLDLPKEELTINLGT
jgi:hypothetical protein